MNINATELLLLNKKIKFGEGAGGTNGKVEEGANPVLNPNVTLPAPEENKPQTGMNVLMFQGLNNVVSNPELSTNLGIMKEAAPETTGEKTTNEYVAPYKSNIAFQGGKFKSLALGAMMALATLGGVTSCTEEGDTYVNSKTDIYTSLTINYAEDETKWNTFYEMMQDYFQQQSEQDSIDNAHNAEVLKYLQSMMELMKQQGDKVDSYYAEMFKFFTQSTANQEIIIGILVEQGMTQEQALNKLNEILIEVQNGNLTQAEAMKELLELVGDIKGLLQQAINDFIAYFEQMTNKQDELIETNKQGFDELINQGNITNETLQKMTEQNDSLISLSNKASEERQAIKEAIEQANLDSNANFETVVSTLNMNKTDIINAMMKMGYTQIQVENMNAAQILKAIEKNTRVTEVSNQMLSGITKFVSILPGIYQNGQITNAQLNQTNQLLTKVMNYVKVLPEMYANDKITQSQLEEFYKLYQEALEADGEFNAQTLAKLEELVSKLESIEGVLNTISEQLNNMINDFKSFRDQYTDDKNKEFAMLGSIVVDNKIQTAQLGLIQATQKDMAESLEGIKANTDTLLVIAKDDTKHQELIDAIKDIQTGGSGSIDYQKLEDMFKLMGFTIADAINMSSSELQSKIEEFQKTYIETEQKQLEEMQTINGKLDDLSIFAGLSKDEIVNAINDVTNAVNNGNTDITNEIKNLQEQLDKLQAAVDAMYKAIGEQSQKVNQWLSQFDSKFNNALGLLSNIDKNINTIITNQTIANKYLQNLNTAVADLKVAIDEIKVAIDNGDGGSSITLDQLEELWKQHDEANYNRYKELLENLDINVDIDTTTIEGLLNEINNKMDGINDNSAILDQILDLLEGIDWTKPDYSDKLNRIIEILENFKCNCECGGNNEGIIGDLEEVLG